MEFSDKGLFFIFIFNRNILRIIYKILKLKEQIGNLDG